MHKKNFPPTTAIHGEYPWEVKGHSHAEVHEKADGIDRQKIEGLNCEYADGEERDEHHNMIGEDPHGMKQS